MSELNEAQREALLASAQKHEEAAAEIKAVGEQLLAAGYSVYAKKLVEVVIQMIGHVDTARDIARNR